MLARLPPPQGEIAPVAQSQARSLTLKLQVPAVSPEATLWASMTEVFGRVSVPVEAFEGRNLIFVDEGHKGSGGEAWSKYRDALGKLVNNQTDPVYIIKWKDIYQLLEDASDRAEDIANVLEGIVLKNA